MLMFGLIGFLILILVPAGIAAAAAWALSVFVPKWSVRRRTVVAALTGGFLFMTIPLVAAASDPGNEAIAASLVSLVVIGLILSAVAGLPAAVMVGRRREPAKVEPSTFD